MIFSRLLALVAALGAAREGCGGASAAGVCARRAGAGGAACVARMAADARAHGSAHLSYLCLYVVPLHLVVGFILFAPAAPPPEAAPGGARAPPRPGRVGYALTRYA